MTISEEQRNAIRAWLAAGDSLADVQRKLKEEFRLTMTYMDVRLLVLEIGAEVQEESEPEPKPVPPPVAADAPPSGRPGPWKRPPAEEEESGDEAGGNVSISIDRLVVPGAMVSGDVTFSDGVKARWLIDRMGRFGLEPEQEGYHPSEEDLQMFQMELRAELQRKGYA